MIRLTTIIVCIGALLVISARAQPSSLACPPGEVVPLTGTGPPNSSLLIRFDDRYVGGGSSDARGAYALHLHVGEERPGEYPVAIEVRGSREVVDQMMCVVPGASPTLRPGEPTHTPDPDEVVDEPTQPPAPDAPTVTVTRPPASAPPPAPDTPTVTATRPPASAPPPAPDAPTITVTVRPSPSPSPSPAPGATTTPTRDPSLCDPSYPTLCIPPPPPNLNCRDIGFKDFEVVPPDPHDFDGDNDGVGCEEP